MTALLFKNWGFPHKVFKGVQTFESKKIKETLQIQRFSHFLILPQTGIEPVRVSLPRDFKSRASASSATAACYFNNFSNKKWDLQGSNL